MLRSVLLVRRALGAAVCGLVVLGSVTGLQADNQPSADGWRRTANGWEHQEDWYVQSLRAAYPRREFLHANTPNSPPATRWDFHPAMLAILQGLAIAAAFRVWPRSTSSAIDGVRSAIGQRPLRLKAA
jgi:hypothetical protein